MPAENLAFDHSKRSVLTIGVLVSAKPTINRQVTHRFDANYSFIWEISGKLRCEWDSLQVCLVNIQKGIENCQFIVDLPIETACFP